VGKSILTLSSSPEEDIGGRSSVFDIAQAHHLSSVILVEDSLIGFLEAKRVAADLAIEFVFGLRLSMCDDMTKAPKKSSRAGVHKIIVFARDTQGALLLNKIYTASQTSKSGNLDFSALKKFYNSKHLKIAIPFYDSFLFHNLFSYKEPCLLDDSFFTPTFFLEDNFLPFDGVLRGAVEDYAAGSGYKTELVKTIYYEKREDFEAYQTYKCICGRGFSTRAKTLDMPNLDHCGSPEFCFESYLDYESS